MSTVLTFRRSLYLSLAIAILAIGVAGGDLLPELPFVTGLCLVMLAAAYVIDGRWQLSLRNANLFGLVLGGLLGLWAIFQVVRPPTGLSETLPWPASALPYLAPVIMILIPAKMLRPKHVGDYWVMYGLSLLSMALACALAMDGVFILIFIVFAVAFIWSLGTFQLYREVGPEQAAIPLGRSGWKALRPAVLWATVTGAAAVPLFWITPRTGAEWELAINTRGHSVTGISDGPVDLNKTGTVDVTSEKSFEFFAATPSGEPFLDMPHDQRFRTLYLHNYDSGRWVRNQSTLQTADRAVSPAAIIRDPHAALPDLGPGTIHLTYIINLQLSRSPPVADPVAWRVGQQAPILSRLDERTYRSWVHKFDGSFDGAVNFDSAPPEYVQAWAPPAQYGKSPVMRVADGNGLSYLRYTRGLYRLKEYTSRLVERLVAEGTLPPEVLSDIDPAQNRNEKYYEAIARALEHHLSSSGEFTYTLNLTRKDKTIDPTEDFLLNTKSGHCSRFATALVLMLRSQGIPAQMVLGYRGCTPRGDGWYEVHEDQAHAWVEVLVPASDPQPPAGDAVARFWKPMQWMTLDPTPSGPENESDTNASLLGQARQKWDALLKALLLAYNRESREQAAEAVGQWLTDEGGWRYLACAAAFLTALVLWRRRARKRAALYAGFPDAVRRLAIALARAGHHWPPGETAKEFAASAGAVLAAQPATASVADVPSHVVAAYYSERFGARPPNPTELQQLEAGLRQLQRALA